MQADIHLQMWSLWILCSLQKWASRTNKCLFFRPFFSYSRAPQVRCQVAGAQSCSWYFIGILQLRETVALGTMLQLPPLGTPGFILLNCSPKNTDLDSQVRCTLFCAALLAQDGHKTHLNLLFGLVWPGRACWGFGLLRPPCEAASEESTEVLESLKDVCACSNLQKQSLSVCKDYVPGLAHCYVKEVIWGEFWENPGEYWYFVFLERCW